MILRDIQTDFICDAEGVLMLQAVALELCMLHEQRAKNVEGELQQLIAQINERDHRNGLVVRVAEDTRDHFKQQLLATQKVCRCSPMSREPAGCACRESK